MHKIITSLLASCLLLISSSCSSNSDEDVKDNVVTDKFYLGADVSWITEMEHTGHKFSNTDGMVCDGFALIKSYGINAVRLRVWVDPSEHGSWCSKEDVLEKALRAKRLGMDVMIDFHYSDWWADPGKQNIPKAWEGHSYEMLKKDVAEHTAEVLRLLKDNGITPQWVQVGNETSNGLLWPQGQAERHPKQYAGLFMAGYNAVKKVFPDTKVIVHLDSGHDEGLYNWNLDILKDNGARWDIIGMSVYPYWSKLPADMVISRSISNIKHLAYKYGCSVMVVETGMECADDKGLLADESVLTESRRQLSRLINECMNNTDGQCKGVFYWEPECRPGMYRLGAFTEDGRPTIIMDAFKSSTGR